LGVPHGARLEPHIAFFGLLMDVWKGPDYETGLTNLKAVVEVASLK